MLKRFFLLLSVLCLCASIALTATAESFVINMVGDCCLGDQYLHAGNANSFTGKMKQWGKDYPFANVAGMFAEDDLTLANCEGVFTTRKPTKNSKYNPLISAPEWAEVFTLGNVDVCNTMNNHAKDLGNKGWHDTLDALAEQGIGAFGDEILYSCEIRGVKIGFVGYSFPMSDQKLRKYKNAFQQLRDEGCTFIVASVHWGKEAGTVINGDQKKYGTKLIDAGADLVYGHGSHTLLPVQVYNGKLIIYSTSNFVFGGNAAPKDDDTAVFQVTYDIQDDHTMTLAELNIIPCKMHKDRNYQPYEITDPAGREKVWSKCVFHRKKDPSSGLPESFLTTGYANFRETDAASGEEQE